MEQGAWSKGQGAWSMEQGACKDPPAGGDEVPRIGRARGTRTWLFYDLYTLQVSFTPSSYGVAGIPKRPVNFDESKK